MDDDERPIRIGVSSCLLGCKVRFDGGHKKDDFLVDTFGNWVQWVPVCPEVEVGMGTPARIDPAGFAPPAGCGYSRPGAGRTGPRR